MAQLKSFPIELNEANEFVRLHHRHHIMVVGHKFSIGALIASKIVGVVIVGRPVARGRDDGFTLEVTRLCTDGTKNACSFLYALAARATFALGYRRIGTYILKQEDGVSVKAAGWYKVREVKGRSWSTPSRIRIDKHPTVDKLLFEKVHKEHIPKIDHLNIVAEVPSLFNHYRKRIKL